MFFTRRENNMRVFLGVLMALIVSGDGEKDTSVNGELGGSVLLPCICSDRNQDQDFKWQMELKKKVMFSYKTPLSIDRTYKGRTKTFLSENRYNCSILLTNITADDQGLYKCIFHKGEMYQRPSVNLNISVSDNICQSSVNLSGRNPDCTPENHDKTKQSPILENSNTRGRYLIFVPVVLAFSLFLWSRQITSKRLLRNRQVVTTI